MPVQFAYRVVEHYDDEAPEPFGMYVGSPDVNAYKVIVTDRDEMSLDVRSVS